MKYVWGVIFVILFLGCARDTPLVNNKKDLKNYIQPYKEILLFAQGCSYNKDMAKNKALTNFSLKIYSNLQSSFNKNETLHNDKIDKKTTYNISQKSVYNDLFGLKYYIEEPYEKNNIKIYCVDVYIDFNYFTTFEEGFKNKILNLNYMIDNLTLDNYKEKHKIFIKKLNKLLSYLWIYKSWAIQHFYEDKSNYFQKSLEKLKVREKNRIDEFKKEYLDILKTRFQEYLDNHKIVDNKKEKSEVINKLLSIKQNGRFFEIELHMKNSYFKKFTIQKLKDIIKIKPLCSFSFQANKFLQWRKYLIINGSYKKDCECDLNCKFKSPRDIKIINRNGNYYFIPKSSGYHWIKLEVDADGVKEICRKRIYIIPHDPRLDRIKKGVNIETFKKKLKNILK